MNQDHSRFSSLSAPTLTEELSAWALGVHTEQLPTDVIELAKDCLLDHVAAALHGMRQPWSGFVAEQAIAEGGVAEASIYGTGRRVPARAAAMVNGTAAHAFELDDWHAGSLSHLGACVIPAVLGVAEQHHLSGRQALAAIVAGFEVMARAGMAVVPTVIIHGFHPTGTHGPMGAAAAVANLLQLTPSQATSAIAIAASCAGGLMEFSQDPQGMMVKRFHAGRAAESGVLSARLAQRGLTGPKSALDGKFGYAHVFSREPRPEALTQGLGKDFQICHNNIKLYACCGALHAGMDIASEMVKTHGFDTTDIAEIVFGGNQSHLVRHTNARPDSVMAAQYSMPYALAVALTGRALDPRMFDEDAFQDEELLRIASLVRVEQHPEVENAYPAKLGAHLLIRLRNGRVFERMQLEARGTGADRISRSEIRRKAQSLCEPFMHPEHMNTLFDRLLVLDEVADMAELAPWMDKAVKTAA